MILKITIFVKRFIVLKMSLYYQYVYLEITVSWYNHGRNYFILVPNRHTLKVSDVQLMMHRNQYSVAALHIVVSMNV